MAEAVVSIALQTLGDPLFEEAKLLFGIDREVNTLQTLLEEIMCFLKDAHRKQHESETVRKWILEIRDLAYRSEDVVEEYSSRMSSSSDGWGRRLVHILGLLLPCYQLAQSLFPCVLNCFSLYQLRSEMLRITSELARVTKAMEGYGISKIIDGAAVSSQNQILARMSFPNFVIGDCFVGKEEDLKQLVSLVADDKEHPVISVWGMGGIGKTTITKKVYNQMKEAKNSCFDCFVWVCISQQCQIRTVLEDILKQVEGGSVSDLSDVQLIEHLCEIQTNKRCLIVADDLWQTSHWDALKHAFPLDNLQSKILVTTRKSNLVDIGFSLQLGLLNMDEGLELLQKKAFPPHGLIPEDFQLDEIGKEMVKKCGYLPLAISLIGGLLSKRKSMAELMLMKENVSAYVYRGDGNIEGENEMHAMLNLSYEDLPYYLKPCFLYLGILKEDEEIKVDDLYKKWIAQGMISDEMIRGEETLVDLAEFYLGELASRCMVQVEYSFCKLHDVVREFCLSTGKKEEFGVEVLEYRDGNFGSLLPIASRSINKTRHLAIHFEGQVRLEGGGDLTITICESLRSLEILKNISTRKIQFPPESIIDFEKFKVLRELLIENFSFEDRNLPKGITKLVHLRYFGLRHCTHLDKLPSSICNLVHLDTLDLYRSENLQVPNVFKKMRRFKHLILPWFYGAITIGDYRLRLDEGVDELETLELFDSRVHELKSTVRMKNLRRFMGKIYDNKCLLAIVSAVTRHWNKLQFCSLSIRESCELTSSDEVLRSEECKIEDPMPIGILGNLHCLTHLYIESSYVGQEMTCPTSSFPRLKYLHLWDLEKLREWRVEQGAMPLLFELKIFNCSNLKEWRMEQGAMPLLSKLHISHCPNLREWRVEQGVMPLLSELLIVNCSNLKELRMEQGVMPLLSKLHISHCPNLREWRIGQGAMPLLSNSDIHYCPGLKKVPDEVGSISAEDKLNIYK
ncbi:hypothetical protein C2S52_018798 [Perilla frutescens var. hirtella]|nr:hypothetical protein C2S52_018798 [Perilla frutescens var. hirtella]